MGTDTRNQNPQASTTDTPKVRADVNIKEELSQVKKSLWGEMNAVSASAMAIIDDDYPADSEFWKKSALIAAQSIVDDNKEEGRSISRAALKTELKDNYLFTDAQATYGANNAKL